MKHPFPFLIVLALLGGLCVFGVLSNSPSQMRMLLIILAASYFLVLIASLFILTLNKNTAAIQTKSQNSSFPPSSSENNTEMQNLLNNLKETQKQLVEQERMASIGMLSAGIAHEIKNPLNFINNFADMTVELLQELKSEIETHLKNVDESIKQEIHGTIEDIVVNCIKINEHGKRAESIIKSMLTQARTADADKTSIDINTLLDEFLNLSYHGMRSQNNTFNVKLERHLDKNIDKIVGFEQNIGRVFLNIINNGLYAAFEKAQKLNKDGVKSSFMPTISIATEQNNEYVIIKIKDNGMGIPDNLKKKIFEPFYTTKPAGQGTGLGLPICYDIVVTDHKGKLDINSIPGEFTEFIIMLPREKEIK